MLHLIVLPCLALPDGVWGNLLHPSHSLRKPVSPAWRPDPEPSHQHYILCFWDLHHAAGHLRCQVRRMAWTPPTITILPGEQKRYTTDTQTYFWLVWPNSCKKRIQIHASFLIQHNTKQYCLSLGGVKENVYSCHICRLPILQGGTFALLTPAMAMLSMPEWKCPDWTNNATLVNTSSPVFIEVWQSRMRTVS